MAKVKRNTTFSLCNYRGGYLLQSQIDLIILKYMHFDHCRNALMICDLCKYKILVGKKEADTLYPPFGDDKNERIKSLGRLPETGCKIFRP